MERETGEGCGGRGENFAGSFYLAAVRGKNSLNTGKYRDNNGENFDNQSITRVRDCNEMYGKRIFKLCLWLHKAAINFRGGKTQREHTCMLTISAKSLCAVVQRSFPCNSPRFFVSRSTHHRSQLPARDEVTRFCTTYDGSVFPPVDARRRVAKLRPAAQNEKRRKH